jgi:DNA processing protein
MSAERLAYIALAQAPGIGPRRLSKLLERFGGAQAVLAASPDELRARRVSAAAATAIRRASVDRAEKLAAETAELGGCILIPADPEFPQSLRETYDPPVLLFAMGRLELLGRPAVAMVGSRGHTRYGAEVVRHLAGGCARAGLVVVSGMARGIDALAHHAALDAGGGTIGVLGNGLGVIYPSANRALYARAGRDGLLITEFSPGERPNAGSFPERNRLIGGLARVTVVIEARERSGALITVGCALRDGREAMAVPGPITSPVSVGCNRLIQNGSKPVLGLRDILEEYGIGCDAPACRIPTDLTDAERRTLGALNPSPRHVDDLAASLGLDTAETLALLTSLEIRGLAEHAPGKFFSTASALEHAVGSR